MARATVESLLRVEEILYENVFPPNDPNNLQEKMEREAPARQEKKLRSVIDATQFYLVPSTKKGQGLACEKTIGDGKFIMEYTGVYSHDDYVETEDSWYTFHTQKGGWRIDAKNRGGLCRFVNHSCRPNCVMKAFWYQNRVRAFLIAEEFIPKGTELTYNYNFSLASGAKNEICECGAGSDCSGVIGKRLENKENSPKHVCTTCNKAFPSKHKLEVHNTVHTKEKPFPCSICSKSFPHKSNLNRHVRQVHENSRPFACSLCSKRLTTKLNLEKHMKTH